MKTAAPPLRTDVLAVLGVAVALIVPIAIGILGLSLLAMAGWFERMVCEFRLDAPCPGTGAILIGIGVAVVGGAAIGLVIAARYVRRQNRARLVLPALTVIFAVLFMVALVNGEGWGNAVVEFGGLAAATGVLSIRIGPSRALQAAVVAQAADLATFGGVWQLGRGEANPLGGLIMRALGLPGYPEAWYGAAFAGLLLIVAKVALIVFLVRVSPYLARYRAPILVAAALAGAIGAATNLSAIFFPSYV